MGRPLFTNAGTKAVAPGKHSTLILFLIHSRTNKKAGSLIPGVPASVIKPWFYRQPVAHEMRNIFVRYADDKA